MLFFYFFSILVSQNKYVLTKTIAMVKHRYFKMVRVLVSDMYRYVRYSDTLKYIYDTCFLIIFLYFLISDTYWTWFFLSSDMYKYLFFDFLIIDYLRSTDSNTIKSSFNFQRIDNYTIYNCYWK